MATRWDSVPNLDEDVVARTREDIGKVRKRRNVDSTNLKGGARDSVREAGARAGRRLGVRGGAMGAALKGGYDAGRFLDETTGVGRKIVDAAGPMIDRVATGERVKLTDDAKRRIKEEEDFQDMQKALREADEGYAKGGKVRGWGAARSARKAKVY